MVLSLGLVMDDTDHLLKKIYPCSVCWLITVCSKLVPLTMNSWHNKSNFKTVGKRSSFTACSIEWWSWTMTALMLSKLPQSSSDDTSGLTDWNTFKSCTEKLVNNYVSWLNPCNESSLPLNIPILLKNETKHKKNDERGYCVKNVWIRVVVLDLGWFHRE